MNKKTSSNDTRTANVVRNVWVGLICQILVLFASFANRTIFIKALGNDYLSIMTENINKFKTELFR